jgi:hypothetical protein
MLPVINYFASLLMHIRPLPSEVAKARVHGAQIRSRVEKSFKLVSFFPMGSHQRGTAIRHYSDIDYFAVVSRKDARWGDRYKSSNTFLGNLRDTLAERFPSTGVSRSDQAVVIDFEQGGFAVDVVPSIFWEFRPFSTPIYLIPDGEGEYIETSPQRQNSYIKTQDERMGGKLRRTIQLLKFWRENRSPRVPLHSFHLEILLASSGVCAGQKPLGRCVYESFRLLRSRECRALIDPLRISGYINAARTEARLDALVRAVDHAYTHSLAAVEAAEIDRNFDEACRQWDIVFNR